MAPKPTKRTVLITGCSDNSLGAALAIAFHKAGLHVYATARNPAKLSAAREAGIETLELDVLSEASIAACASKLSSLDILVNNAGTMLQTPISDLSIPDAKALFDLNVWSYLAVTKAFLPLLVKAEHGGLVVNQTSGAAVMPVPFQSVYNASKAAMASFSETMRLEFSPFDIKVVELRTTIVKSNMNAQKRTEGPVLPEGSIWMPAKELVETSMRGDQFVGRGWETHVWAEGVAKVLVKKNPPLVVYGGEAWFAAKIWPMLPHGSLDGTLKRLIGYGKVEEIIRRYRSK